MKIMKILEQIANNAHHKILYEELINTQPDEIRTAFFTNDMKRLKRYLKTGENFADRCTIFQE